MRGLVSEDDRLIADLMHQVLRPVVRALGVD